MRGGHVLSIEYVLYADRDTVERAERPPFLPRQVRVPRLLQGQIGVQVGPGANPVLDRGNVIEAGADQLLGCHLAGPDGLCCLACGDVNQIHCSSDPTLYLTMPYTRSGSHRAICGKL